MARRNLRTEITQLSNKIQAEIDSGSITEFGIRSYEQLLKDKARKLAELDNKEMESLESSGASEDLIDKSSKAASEYADKATLSLVAIQMARERLEKQAPTSLGTSSSHSSTASETSEEPSHGGGSVFFRSPEIQLDKFSGKDITAFPAWRSAFYSSVDKATTYTDCEKLAILKNSLSDAALAKVQPLLLIPENYGSAKKVLDEEYGDVTLLLSVFVSKLLASDILRDNRGPALQELVNLFERHYQEIGNLITLLRNKETFSSSSEPRTPDASDALLISVFLTPILLSKLPHHLATRYLSENDQADNRYALANLLEFLKRDLRSRHACTILSSHLRPTESRDNFRRDNRPPRAATTALTSGINGADRGPRPPPASCVAIFIASEIVMNCSTNHPENGKPSWNSKTTVSHVWIRDTTETVAFLSPVLSAVALTTIWFARKTNLPRGTVGAPLKSPLLPPDPHKLHHPLALAPEPLKCPAPRPAHRRARSWDWLARTPLKLILSCLWFNVASLTRPPESKASPTFCMTQAAHTLSSRNPRWKNSAFQQAAKLDWIWVFFSRKWCSKRLKFKSNSPPFILSLKPLWKRASSPRPRTSGPSPRTPPTCQKLWRTFWATLSTTDPPIKSTDFSEWICPIRYFEGMLNRDGRPYCSALGSDIPWWGHTPLRSPVVSQLSFKLADPSTSLALLKKQRKIPRGKNPYSCPSIHRSIWRPLLQPKMFSPLLRHPGKGLPNFNEAFFPKPISSALLESPSERDITRFPSVPPLFESKPEAERLPVRRLLCNVARNLRSSLWILPANLRSPRCWSPSSPGDWTTSPSLPLVTHLAKTQTETTATAPGKSNHHCCLSRVTRKICFGVSSWWIKSFWSDTRPCCRVRDPSSTLNWRHE